MRLSCRIHGSIGIARLILIMIAALSRRVHGCVLAQGGVGVGCEPVLYRRLHIVVLCEFISEPNTVIRPVLVFGGCARSSLIREEASGLLHCWQPVSDGRAPRETGRRVRGSLHVPANGSVKRRTSGSW